VYISRNLGITGVGTSVQATRRAQKLLYTLNETTRQLEEDPQFLRSRIERMGKSYPTDPQFHLIFCESTSGFGFAIKEQLTGMILRIDA